MLRGIQVPEPSSRPDEATSEALLASIALGSRDAFEALYRRTSAKLFGICLRVLPARTEAEDVLQEVFASIWQKAAQYDASRASALAWLTMIARNRAIDRLRALPTGAQTTPIDLVAELTDPQAAPLDDAERAADRERLDNCLHELDTRRRALIRAAFFDGSTYEELAVRSGSPLGSVKSWIRRGLLQLRACLERP
jgi:RNA polymerase sigma-70 factor (ECF subfamily)